MDNLTRREKEKLAHESDIITAAEIVFVRKGFDGASIDEISKESKFTRRTIYQYFPTKEDLFLSVILKCFRQFFSYLEVELNKYNTGFEKISRAGFAFYQFYRDYPDAIRLMNYIGYIKETAKSSPRYQDYLDINNLLFRELAGIIEKGQLDGSIRIGLKSEELAYSLAFVLTGFFYELSTAGKTFTEHFNLNEKSFVNSTLNLLFQAIIA